ncbi:MAG: hypothetical protein EA397_20300 [Deltaproteobacteria bacterium]|nr:MAG: hypothetical protein EA397_20300 [Deltaproteobacteria bacterium]
MTRAQHEHRGAAVTIAVDQAAVVSNGTIADALGALARTEPSQTVSITANAEGDQALKTVQECFLDSGKLRWSMVRLFSVSPAHRVRPHLYQRERAKKKVFADEATLTVQPDGAAWVSFHVVDSDPCTMFPVPFKPIENQDYERGLEDPPVGHTCDGKNCGRCSWVNDACNCAEPTGDDPSCEHSVDGSKTLSIGNKASYIGQ